MREIVLEFEGYWTEATEEQLPEESGVFCVYRGRPGAPAILRELLYVGEAAKVRSRIQAHEKKVLWKEHLQQDEALYYAVAPIVFDRNRAEAALIHQHKPPENWDFIHDFPFADTAMFVTGRTLLLSPCFAVLETNEREWVS
jgi:excinuclease UvrABC nuclease subunit